MSVIAEGVENRGVADMLKQLKCDRVQGTFYSEPIVFEELKDWLESFDMLENS